jgi:hypothetical protein
MKIVAEAQILQDFPLSSRGKSPIRGRKLRPEIPYDERACPVKGRA